MAKKLLRPLPKDGFSSGRIYIAHCKYRWHLKVLRAAEMEMETTRRLSYSPEGQRVRNDALMAHIDLRLVLTLARFRYEARQRKAVL